MLQVKSIRHAKTLHRAGMASYSINKVLHLLPFKRSSSERTEVSKKKTETNKMHRKYI